MADSNRPTSGLPPACPSCHTPLVRSSNLLEDLHAIVLACRSCKMYAVEGDPDGRWFHRGNVPYGNALAALRACAEELGHRRGAGADERRNVVEEIMTSEASDPRWTSGGGMTW